MSGVSECFERVACVERLAKFGDGVFTGDFWFLRFTAKEGADVEARKGFDSVAVAFTALGFWWDCAMLAGGLVIYCAVWMIVPFLTSAAATSFSS